MGSRIADIRKLLADKNLDSILISKPENVRYVTGFTGSSGHVLITTAKAVFITDFRYMEQAGEQCPGLELTKISKHESVVNIFSRYPLHKIGIEEDFLTYGQYREYVSKTSNIEFIPLEGAITKLRSVKSKKEIEKIEKAAFLTDEAFNYILPAVRPGVKEKDIALELEFFMRKMGADKGSFDFIVASGKRSSLPHGVAGEKRLEEGDFVTMDFGCIYKGYCSDMTRTLVLGQACEKQKEIYSVVLYAQKKALEAVKPGVTGRELDHKARQKKKKKGFGQFFGHGLGHGVGLEIHEQPHINYLGNMPLEPGMVITIEPGIYIPDFGGVRIEDLVLVTETGYKVLSLTNKELIELKNIHI